jgi:hypothetical protein
MAASRAAGQPMAFGVAWRQEGGIFGLLSSLGARDSLAVGAGATLARRGDRMWGAAYSEKAVPLLWDVPIREEDAKAAEGEDQFEVSSLTPEVHKILELTCSRSRYRRQYLRSI